MREAVNFIRSRQPVNLLIVLINSIVLILFSVLGSTRDVYFMAAHGAAYTPLILGAHEYYRLVTSMFLHFGPEHLVYNMILLIFMGDVLEKTVGKFRYLLIYFGGGILGNLATVWVDTITKDYAVSAGASGAIFAVIGALIWIMLRNGGKLEGYSRQRLLLMAALSVAEGFTTTGVANSAHVGGLAAGFLLAVLCCRGVRQKA